MKEQKSLGKLVVHMIEQVYPVVPSVVVEPVCPMVSISIAVATYSLMAWIQVDKMTSVVDSRVYTQVVFVANCIDPALKGVFNIVQAMSEDVRTIQEVPVYYSERNLVRQAQTIQMGSILLFLYFYCVHLPFVVLALASVTEVLPSMQPSAFAQLALGDWVCFREGNRPVEDLTSFIVLL